MKKTLANGAMQTYTGKVMDPIDPDPADICIEDIAHALSLQNRFGGHNRVFYSVARHSLWVARHCKPEHRLCGLMHDATEAYIGDMIRPLKLRIPQFAEIEDRLWKVIAIRFGLPLVIPAHVKQVDNWALMTERRDVCNPPPESWGDYLEAISPATVGIRAPAMPCPQQDERDFLNEFSFLKTLEK